MKSSERKPTPPWQRGRFSGIETDSDPLAGFANIMDVMLVFALGILVALIAQNRELRQHFGVNDRVIVQQGKELVETPTAIAKAMNGKTEGMESLGQVYRDPKSGKLVLIGQ